MEHVHEIIKLGRFLILCQVYGHRIECKIDGTACTFFINTQLQIKNKDDLQQVVLNYIVSDFAEQLKIDSLM